MLHPQIEAALKAMAAAGVRRFEDMTPAEARAQIDAGARASTAPRPDVAVANTRFPSKGGPVAIRIYRSSDAADLPAILYFHGGGHVIGSLDSHDLTARHLCSGAGAVVVSVDYRMGPEYKFPAAVEDAYDALLWLAANAGELGVDAGRIGVAGDSAGANLAVVVAILARDAGGPALKLQSLVYPVIDYGLTDDSYERFAEGFGIVTTPAMHWFRNHYLRDLADAADWRASPIKAADLSGLPPAIVTAAECDVLVDEGKRYADALRASGVAVDYRLYPGMIHGFFGMIPAIDDAVTAQRAVHAAFREAFAGT